MTIGDLLDEQARLRPDILALVDARAGRTYTFQQLQAAVTASAREWEARGMRKGDAALIFVPMSADLYIALLGLFRIGAVALFLDPSAGLPHLERCCSRWEPRALLAIPKAHWLRLRSSTLRRIPIKISVGGWAPFSTRWTTREAGSPEIGRPIAASDPALVTFTSGSTGIPKATVRTHAFLISQYHALAPSLTLRPGDTDLATLPIFVLANLAAGVTTILPSTDLRRPDRVNAATLFSDIESHGVTRLTASPALFERLIEFGLARNRTLPTLTLLHTGGAPVFPRLLAAMQHLAPHAEVIAVYGSTEAEPIAHLSRSAILADDLSAMAQGRGLLAGTVVPEIRLAIIPDTFGVPLGEQTPAVFAAACLPPDHIGEIVVTGDHVLKGYLGGVGDQETKFTVGGEIWHRTGDAGSLDAEGRLWLHGRCSAKIRDGRGEAYPLGLEGIAMGFPQIKRAALIASRGRRILVVEASADPELRNRLRREIREGLVDGIHFLDKLPVDRRHNAKVDYPALRLLLERDSAVPR